MRPNALKLLSSCESPIDHFGEREGTKVVCRCSKLVCLLNLFFQVRAYVSQLLSIVEILIVNVLRRHKAIELSFMTEKEGAANSKSVLGGQLRLHMYLINKQVVIFSTIRIMNCSSSPQFINLATYRAPSYRLCRA